MLGIIIAMETEINSLLKNKFKDVFCHQINGQKFYVIKTMQDQDAVITFSGIGKTNATIATTLMINAFNITACLNIGASCIVSGMDVNDILVVDKAMYGDVDVTKFGYEINQIPKTVSAFHANDNLKEQIISMLNFSSFKFSLGNNYTCDSFVNSNNFNKFNIPKESNIPTTIDMECASIAHTCNKLLVPFCAIKIGSDKLWDKISNEQQFDKNLINIANKIDVILLNLIDSISYYIINKKNSKDK